MNISESRCLAYAKLYLVLCKRLSCLCSVVSLARAVFDRLLQRKLHSVSLIAFLLFKNNLLRLLENPALHAKVKIRWNFIFEKNYVPHVFLIFCFLCAGRLEFLVIICHSKTALCFYDLSKNCLLHFTYS